MRIRIVSSRSAFRHLAVQVLIDLNSKDNYFVWASLELYVGIIASSLPTLKPILSSFLETAKTAFYTNRKYGRSLDPTAHIVNCAKLDEEHGRVYNDHLTLPTPSYQTPGKEKDSMFSTEKRCAGAESYKVQTECSRSRSIDSTTERPAMIWRRSKSLPNADLESGILVTTKVLKHIEQRHRPSL